MLQSSTLYHVLAMQAIPVYNINAYLFYCFILVGKKKNVKHTQPHTSFFYNSQQKQSAST